MDQAAVFLAASILTVLGFIVFVIGVVLVNNIFYKYWKPIKWSQQFEFSPRFVEELKKDQESRFK
jgi:hypothetical protein